jgi:hypothetical protein
MIRMRAILCLLLVATVSHVAIADWSIAPVRGGVSQARYLEYKALRSQGLNDRARGQATLGLAEQ